MYPYYELLRSKDNQYFNMFMAKDLLFPPHLHFSVEVIYVISGSLNITINDKTKNLQTGDLAVSFPNDIHSYKTETNSDSIIMIFNPELINSYFAKRVDKTLENPFLCNNNIGEDIVMLINMLLRNIQQLITNM